MPFRPDDDKAAHDAWGFFRGLAEAKQHGHEPNPGQLREAAVHARRFEKLLDEYPQDCEAAYQRFLASDQVSDSQKEAFRRTVEQSGGFVPWMKKNTAALAAGKP